MLSINRFWSSIVTSGSFIAPRSNSLHVQFVVFLVGLWWHAAALLGRDPGSERVDRSPLAGSFQRSADQWWNHFQTIQLFAIQRNSNVKNKITFAYVCLCPLKGQQRAPYPSPPFRRRFLWCAPIYQIDDLAWLEICRSARINGRGLFLSIECTLIASGDRRCRPGAASC